MTPAARRPGRAGLGRAEHPYQPGDARADRGRDWLTVFQLPAYAPELNLADDLHRSSEVGRLLAQDMSMAFSDRTESQ